MPTVLEVYNMALDQAGVRAEMAELNEDTPEGRAVRRWYQPVVDQAHRAVFWNFARRVQTLTNKVVETTGVWTYRYDMPTDLIAARYLEAQYAPFVFGNEKIFTNVDNARLVYTGLESVPNAWDSMFLMAVSFALAGAVSLPLMGNRATANYLIQQANVLLLQAREANGMEAISLQVVDILPDWIAARDGAMPLDPLTPYITAVGPLFTEIAG